MQPTHSIFGASIHTYNAGKERYLVCSDIAARGLDIPEIGHVVLFDFPLNPIDYLHRTGRCGRAGRPGAFFSTASIHHNAPFHTACFAEISV
jgi:superfamily II DNA/RNA helicase